MQNEKTTMTQKANVMIRVIIRNGKLINFELLKAYISKNVIMHANTFVNRSELVF